MVPQESTARYMFHLNDITWECRPQIQKFQTLVRHITAPQGRRPDYMVCGATLSLFKSRLALTVPVSLVKKSFHY